MGVYLVTEFKRKHKKDPPENKRSLQHLWTACDRAKRIISSFTQASIEIDAGWTAISLCSKTNMHSIRMGWRKSVHPLSQNLINLFGNNLSICNTGSNPTRRHCSNSRNLFIYFFLFIYLFIYSFIYLFIYLFI